MKTKAAAELEARISRRAQTLADELNRKGWVAVEGGPVVVKEDRTEGADEWFPKVNFTVSAVTTNGFHFAFISWTVRFSGRSWKRASVSFYGCKRTGNDKRQLTASNYFIATAGL